MHISNILFVMMQMEMGGSERLIHNLALKMDRKLFNPSIAYFYEGTVLKEFKELNITLYHVPKKKRIDFEAMRMIGNIVRNDKIDIVNAHHFMPMVYCLYGCKIKNRIKLVYTEHSEWEIEKIPMKWRQVGKYLLRQVDGAIGVSEGVSNKLKTNFKTKESKCLTIINGVDIKPTLQREERLSLRRKHNIDDCDRVIGLVANFRKIKNHIFLLEAFCEVAQVYGDAKLILIGKGFEFDPENSEREIRDYIKEKGLEEKVRLLGYRSDVQTILNIMDIFCLVSYQEGLPISLIEAMAVGIPVVGTDVEGIKDIIVPNRNGLLVKVGDINGLKNALLCLLMDESLRNRMAKESRIIAKQRYSLEECVSNYQEFFLSLKSMN